MLNRYYVIKKKHYLFDGVIGKYIQLKFSEKIKILFSKGINVTFVGTGEKCDMNILLNENRKLRKALDNAIKECCINVNGSDSCSSLDELYELFEKKVWKDVE